MSSYKLFDFERSSEIFNALHALEVNLPTRGDKKSMVEHLKPLISASSRSNNRMGRLTKADVKKMEDLGA
jgi:hypothetical protein